MAKKSTTTNTDILDKLESNKQEFKKALKEQNKFLRGEISAVGRITLELQKGYNELTTWKATTMAANQAAKQAVEDYKRDNPLAKDDKSDRGSINNNLLEVVKYALIVAAAALGAKLL